MIANPKQHGAVVPEETRCKSAPQGNGAPG